MRGLAAWRAQIAACRADRPEGEETHWQRAAAWYERWVQNNDYVEQTLARLMPLVHPGDRVLEIGPGTGAFTLALAQAAGEVIAVEPSPGMRQVLEARLAEAGLANVTLVPHRIEEALDALSSPFDVALAAHSLYNVKEVDACLRYLTQEVALSVILMGTGYQQEWLSALHQRFRGRNPVAPANYGEFAQVLEEMGITAEVEILGASANYVYEDVESMVAWWAPKLAVGPDRHAELRRALLEIAERRDGTIGIYGLQRMALIRFEGRHAAQRGERAAQDLALRL